jgi:hypothetical protein
VGECRVHRKNKNYSDNAAATPQEQTEQDSEGSEDEPTKDDERIELYISSEEEWVYRIGWQYFSRFSLLHFIPIFLLSDLAFRV